MQEADQYGFEIYGLSVDWEKLIQTSRRAVKRLGKGVESLFDKNGVDYENGHGRLTGPNTVEVDGESTYEAENVILATGAKPRTLPGIEPDGDRILNSADVMTLDERPDEIVILGAGAIGIEFAYFFDSFDTDVTVIEMEDRILPGEDPEISEELETILTRSGISVELGTAVDSVESDDEGVTVETRDEDQLEASHVLAALGVVPNTDNLWAEELNLRTEDGWIAVQDDLSTSLPDVHAIGDVTGPPWLAHAASHQGVKLVEGILTDQDVGLPSENEIPVCTYCQPQVARVGLTETEAEEEYDDVTVGKFPLRALGRAVAVDETDGFVKLVFAGEYDELVGAHLLGHEVTELISELNLAQRLEATSEELADTIHPHPTFSESIMEAAHDARGHAIHK
jgi:dihydrolipoamide dehydrogenase